MTVMIKRDLLKKHNFNKNLNFIEDFDLILRLSFVTKFKYIETTTAYYRSHENNLSKKITNYVEEYKQWKNSFEQKSKFKFDLKKLNSNIKFLEIKRDIIFGKKIAAFKKIISNNFYGNAVKSLKYIFCLFLPTFIILFFENCLTFLLIIDFIAPFMIASFTNL